MRPNARNRRIKQHEKLERRSLDLPFCRRSLKNELRPGDYKSQERAKIKGDQQGAGELKQTYFPSILNKKPKLHHEPDLKTLGACWVACFLGNDRPPLLSTHTNPPFIFFVGATSCFAALVPPELKTIISRTIHSAVFSHPRCKINTFYIKKYYRVL